MERLFVGFLQLYVFAIALTIVCVPVSYAGVSQALEEGINGDFTTARKSFKDLADIKEKELQNVDFQIALRNCAAVGFYRVLEQVASDTLEKKISVNAAKQLMKAGKLASIGQNKDAITLTSSTLPNLQNYPVAYFLLGRFYLRNCLEQGKDCENSLKAYRTALKYDPKLIYAYIDMGMLYGNKQKSYEAIKAYEKVSTIASNDGVKGIAHLNLALQFALSNKWSQANENVKKATSLGVKVPNWLVSEAKKHH